MPADFFDLERFVTAQAPAIDAVRGELRRGLKTSHWMWFIFPQLEDGRVVLEGKLVSCTDRPG